MRSILLATTALMAVASVAHAQIIVNDPPALIKDAVIAINTAQTVENGYKEISGIIHGNGFGIGSLVPGLNSGLTTNPLAGVNPTSMMSGLGGAGGLSGLLNQFSGQTMPFNPTGNDPEAVMLRQRAQAAAGQMAVGQQFMNGSTSRLSMLPQLGSSITNTADIKDSVDAGTRVNFEQTTQGAQQQQLQALAIYQQAEANAEASRRDLALRQSAEGLATSSQNAATAAGNGNISLVNN